MTGQLDAPYGLDPTEHDPGAWGASLLYTAELLMAILETAGAGSVTEIGALDGDLTQLLLIWAHRRRARILAVDPSPRPSLEALEREHAALELVREPSLAALAHIALTDTIVLDGDHNYWTVSQELRIIAERVQAEQREFPLLLLHDVGWPHGRRDDYFAPEEIPAEHRQPIAPEGCLYPGDPGIRPGALPYHHPAAREGGPGNGVLTAAEDFVAGWPHLRLAIVPSFFGLGVVWDTNVPTAQALSALIAPWDGNPHVARLEANRVLHLANTQLQLSAVRDAERRLAEQARRLARQRARLEQILASRAFTAIERLLSARGRDVPFSREAIRRALSDGEQG